MNERRPKKQSSTNRGRAGHSSSRSPNASQQPPRETLPDDPSIETEFGVPFAGRVLPEEQWAKTAVKRLPESGTLDFDELFGRQAPRVLDIGCGNGRFLLSSAVRRPEMDHIGIDALPMVIRYATRRANVRGLSNCRLAVCDGVRFLRNYCATGSLHEIHIYHPQPYPDPAEHHLRLFQPEFLWLMHEALAPGGLVVVQTDNAAYWKYIQTVMPAVTDWREQSGPWPEDPQGRSRREIVAIHKGLNIYRGYGTRLDGLDRATFDARCAEFPAVNFNAVHDTNPNRWRRR